MKWPWEAGGPSRLPLQNKSALLRLPYDVLSERPSSKDQRNLANSTSPATARGTSPGQGEGTLFSRLA